MPLTDIAIKTAKPGEKAIRLFDERGLYLEVAPSGGKWWRFKYRYRGKEKRLSLGTYPDVSLKEARGRRDKARKLLDDGVDPSEERKAVKRAELLASDITFEKVAHAWFEKHMAERSESHKVRIWNRMVGDVFPWVGSRPVSEITSPEILACLRRIEDRGATDTVGRIRWACSKVFQYAIAAGLAQNDPAEILKGALVRHTVKPFPTITDPAQVGQLMRALDALEAGLIVRCATRLAPLVFVRPGELRQAEWTEFNLEKAEWRIPAEKMKARVIHIVPLSRQAVAILREIEPLTSGGRYVFPSIRTTLKPMSENTVNAALRRLGYTKEEFTGHSFRKIASTMLNESHLWHRDAIERQLAHSERDHVRAAYNYAEHLPERVRMMQWWADHLNALKSGPGVGTA